MSDYLMGRCPSCGHEFPVPSRGLVVIRCTDLGHRVFVTAPVGEGPSSLASETPIDGPSHPKDGA